MKTKHSKYDHHPNTHQTLYDTWRRAGFRQLLLSRAPNPQDAATVAMLTTRFHHPVMSEAAVGKVLADIPAMYQESAMDGEEISELVAEKRKVLEFLDRCAEINKSTGDPGLQNTWPMIKGIVDPVMQKHEDNFSLDFFKRMTFQILQASRVPSHMLAEIAKIFELAQAAMDKKAKTKNKGTPTAGQVTKVEKSAKAVTEFDAHKAADLSLCVNVFREQMLTALPSEVPVVVPFSQQLRRAYDAQKHILDRLGEPEQATAAHARASSIIDIVSQQVVVQATGLDMEIVQEQVDS